jgi:hypothetical protein
MGAKALLDETRLTTSGFGLYSAAVMLHALVRFRFRKRSFVEGGQGIPLVPPGED